MDILHIVLYVYVYFPSNMGIQSGIVERTEKSMVFYSILPSLHFTCIAYYTYIYALSSAKEEESGVEFHHPKIQSPEN